MSMLITTCPECGRIREIDPMSRYTTCRCGCRYNVWDYMDDRDPEPDPDYGGAFDGHTVTSDADEGL